MICPDCGKLIGVGEEKCPFCGAWRPGLYGFTPRIQQLFGRRLDMIGLIVVTCVVLYVTSLILQPSAIFQMRGLFGILSPGTRALYQLGMTGGVAWDAGWWWTVFTAIYLHGGLLHILFNMIWVRQLGPEVTEVFGPARAFVVFTIAGAAGFLLSNVVTHHPTIGASGSIFGLLAAMIVFGRRRGISVLTMHYLQWAVLLFVIAFVMSGVNNWAHAGGFAGGWISATAMRSSDERRESRGVLLLALAFIAITVAGFALSFVKVTGILLTGR